MKQITIDKEQTLPTLNQMGQLFLHLKEKCNSGKDSPSGPTRTPQTLSQMCLSAESAA